MIPMSKRSSVGLVVVGILLAVLVAGIVTTDFDPEYDTPQGLPTFTTSHNDAQNIYDEGGNLKENSLPFAIFEKYGFVLIPLAILMFGAMVGGVVISKEEVEE
jgi:NADH:ubiquinone oxidoreductase subunit 6 (subunit J)